MEAGRMMKNRSVEGGGGNKEGKNKRKIKRGE